MQPLMQSCASILFMNTGCLPLIECIFLRVCLCGRGGGEVSLLSSANATFGLLSALCRLSLFLQHRRSRSELSSSQKRFFFTGVVRFFSRLLFFLIKKRKKPQKKISDEFLIQYVHEEEWPMLYVWELKEWD